MCGERWTFNLGKKKLFGLWGLNFVLNRLKLVVLCMISKISNSQRFSLNEFERW